MVRNAFLKMNNIIYRRTGSVLHPETSCSAIWAQDLLSDERNALVCEGIARFVKSLPYCVIELVQDGSILTFIGRSYKTNCLKFQKSIDLTKKWEIINL